MAFSLAVLIVQIVTSVRIAGTLPGYKSMSDRSFGIRVYYADYRLIGLVRETSATRWDEPKLELSSFQLVAGS
jgi:hypothetical protein